MCYSGSVFCVCCGRQYDNGIVAGCGCTSNKCDDCLTYCKCQIKHNGEKIKKWSRGGCTG